MEFGQSFEFTTGVLAQLVERLNGIEEVRGSNPLGSTTLEIEASRWFFELCNGVTETLPSSILFCSGLSGPDSI